MASTNTPRPTQQQQGGGGGGEVTPLWKRIVFVIVLQWALMNMISPRTGPAQSIGNSSLTNQSNHNNKTHLSHQNYVPEGTLLNMYCFLSESDINFDPFDLLWFEDKLVYGWDASATRTKYVEILPSKNVQNNGSLYMHTFWTVPGFSPVDGDPNYLEPLLSNVHQLNRYVGKDPMRWKKNLISGEVDEAYLAHKKWEEDNEFESDTYQIISHWKTNFTVSLIVDHTPFSYNGIPPQISKHMKFSSSEPTSYMPITYGNDFWLLSEDLHPINSTVTVLPLQMVYEPISLFKWNMMIQMDESMAQSQMWEVSNSKRQSDSLKRILLDNDPYLLIFTFVISILHMIFDTLAFKNDIQFWREKKSMEGMSIQSIYISAVSQFIILLYILDNPDTSWMIVFSVGLGFLIEVWKVTKAVKVSMGKWHGIPYPILTDVQSYSNNTKKYDLDAMKYLYYVLYPLVAIYSVYSLMYQSHKSWYSFLVGTAAGCVYTFGFIMLTPQLFINYKLKSVAHLPGRVFIYKALSTFIDDLFAFLIRMPTLHRLRVFRDDIVFFIYLYQRWIYPVDNRRVEIGGDFDVEAADIELLAAQKREARDSCKTETKEAAPASSVKEKIL